MSCVEITHDMATLLIALSLFVVRVHLRHPARLYLLFGRASEAGQRAASDRHAVDRLRQRKGT